MSESSDSVRLELSVNGQIVATSGVGTFGVLTGIVSWVRRNPDAIPEHVESDPEVDPKEWCAEELVADLGGLDSVRNESLNWVNGQPLKIGDEVTIRVLGPGRIDEAERRQGLTCSDQGTE